jgi:dUTP pyrophosphatase
MFWRWRKKRMKVAKLYIDSKIPTRAYRDDAGYDLYATESVYIEPGQTVKVSVGIAASIPAGHVGFLSARSSMNARGLLTHTGIIDCGYTGELSAVFTNLTRQSQQLGQGQRIAQLVIVPIYQGEVEEVAHLEPSERGDGGFGSSGA